MIESYLVDIEDKAQMEATIDTIIDLTSDTEAFVSKCKVKDDFFEFETIFGDSIEGGEVIAFLEGKNHTPDYIYSIDKYRFYKTCFKEGLGDKIALVVGNLIKANQYINANFNTTALWEDEETTAGLVAAGLLAVHRKRYIPLFIDFLKTNDLNHETTQSDHIKAVIAKHSWCAETINLLIARLTELKGQFGTDDFYTFLDDYSLQDYLEEKGLKASFISKVKAVDPDFAKEIEESMPELY